MGRMEKPFHASSPALSAHGTDVNDIMHLLREIDKRVTRVDGRPSTFSGFSKRRGGFPFHYLPRHLLQAALRNDVNLKNDSLLALKNVETYFASPKDRNTKGSIYMLPAQLQWVRQII